MHTHFITLPINNMLIMNICWLLTKYISYVFPHSLIENFTSTILKTTKSIKELAHRICGTSNFLITSLNMKAKLQKKNKKWMTIDGTTIWTILKTIFTVFFCLSNFHNLKTKQMYFSVTLYHWPVCFNY